MFTLADEKLHRLVKVMRELTKIANTMQLTGGGLKPKGCHFLADPVYHINHTCVCRRGMHHSTMLSLSEGASILAKPGSKLPQIRFPLSFLFLFPFPTPFRAFPHIRLGIFEKCDIFDDRCHFVYVLKSTVNYGRTCFRNVILGDW